MVHTGMSSTNTPDDGAHGGPWAHADRGSQAERELAGQLRDYGRENNISPDEVVHRLKSRGVEGLKVNRLHQIARGKFTTPPYELLLNWAEVLHVDPADFPALYTIRVRLALNNDKPDEAAAHLRKLANARRLAEPDGRQGVARAARRIAKREPPSHGESGQRKAR